MAPETARITVTRKARNDVRDRQIVVSVDGQPFGTLLFGDILTREVPAGEHRIRAHNTLFWRTLDVDLRPGEHARFTAVNRAGFGSHTMLALLGAGPLYLTFERESDPAARPGANRDG